ncbi:MAG: hypothetical protein WCP19_01225 [Chloroflexota bacterium]
MDNWSLFFFNLKEFIAQSHFQEFGFWPYLVLAIVVAIEGPIATLLGAAAASAGLMKPVLVSFSAACGNLLADTTWYYLGYIGKIEWLYKIGQRFGLRREKMEQVQKNIRYHSVKVLFFAKLSMSLMIPALIAAGLVKAPWRKWFPAVFGGEFIWTGSLVLIGFYATEAIKKIEQGLEYFILFATIGFVLFIIFLSRKILMENEKDIDEDHETWANE